MPDKAPRHQLRTVRRRTVSNATAPTTPPDESADPVELLHRAAESLQAASDGASRFAAAFIARVLADPSKPARLALSLPSRRGGEPGWRRDRRARRDELLRQVVALDQSDRSPTMKIRTALAELGDYRERVWPRDRTARTPPTDARRALFFEIMQCGLCIPAITQLRKIVTAKI